MDAMGFILLALTAHTIGLGIGWAWGTHKKRCRLRAYEAPLRKIRSSATILQLREKNDAG